MSIVQYPPPTAVWHGLASLQFVTQVPRCTNHTPAIAQTLRDCTFLTVAGLRGSASLIMGQAVVTEVTMISLDSVRGGSGGGVLGGKGECSPSSATSTPYSDRSKVDLERTPASITPPPPPPRRRRPKW